MVKLKDKVKNGLTENKKKILKNLQGSASSPIDLNKIMEQMRYEKEYFCN